MARARRRHLLLSASRASRSAGSVAHRAAADRRRARPRGRGAHVRDGQPRHRARSSAPSPRQEPRTPTAPSGPRRARSRAGARRRRSSAPRCCTAGPTCSRSTSTSSALLETRDMGMAIGDARWCVGNAAAVMRYYAGAVDKFFGSTIPVDRDGIVLTFREPIGVAALITPWNFPLNIANWKTAPALAAGNTVVLKPASLSPLSALRYAELGLEAGLPPGVLNVVPGPGRAVGDALVEHPLVAQGRVHRLDRGRGRDRAQGGRDDQARHARARRQERLHRVRRRRPREGRANGAVLGVRERRPGLLRPLAAPRRGVREGRAARALRRRDPRDRRSATRRTRRRRWARSSRPAARDGRGLRRRSGVAEGADGDRGRRRAPTGSTAGSTCARRSSTAARTR